MTRPSGTPAPYLSGTPPDPVRKRTFPDARRVTFLEKPMGAPRIITGTNRPHLIDVPLSDEELEALEAMARATELSRDSVIRHALRVFHAGLLRPEPAEPIGCMGD